MLARETLFHLPVGDGALNGYRLEGTSPGGIFLHGFRSHCNGEKSVALAHHAARRGRSWLRFDQRFCGGSDTDFARFTVSGAVRDTVTLLNWIRQPAVLVGSSLGAFIALMAAAQRPDKVCGLLLIAPAIHFPERYFLSLPEEEVARWRVTREYRFPDHYRGGSFTMNYEFYEDLATLSHPDPWKFDCAVSILHGEKDELLPPQDSLDLEEMLSAPSVSVHVVPGGDHRLNEAIPLMRKELDRLW